jgi:hypothetical protein
MRLEKPRVAPLAEAEIVGGGGTRSLICTCRQ